MDSGSSILQGSEEEVRGAIAAFEEILAAMPNDRVALETLFEGYIMLERSDKAAEFLARLAEVILEENDKEALSGLIPALHQHAGLSPEVAAILNRAESELNLKSNAPRNQARPAQKTAPGPLTSPAPKEGPSSTLNANDITAELSMAWNIHQAKEFTEEEYSGVVHDLSELCSRQLAVPVTVLHVLQDRHSASLDRVIQFVVRDSNTPFIKLNRFDMDPTLIKKPLPEKTARHRGALVFEEMAGDSLVAILNPYDDALKEHVKNKLGPNCHFYLTNAGEYDAAIEKLYAKIPKDVQIRTGRGGGGESESAEKKLGLRLRS